MCGAADGAAERGQRPAQEARQFQPLRLASRERRGRLAELQVIEADVEQRAEPGLDPRPVAEERESLPRRQVEDLGDVPAAVGDLQDFGAIARAPAFGASDHHVGEELHVDRLETVPLAGIAAAPFDVEAELPRVVVPQLRFVGRGEGLADLVEDLEGRHRVRPGGPCQRRLIQEDGIGEIARFPVRSSYPPAIAASPAIRIGGPGTASPRRACSCPPR